VLKCVYNEIICLKIMANIAKIRKILQETKLQRIRSTHGSHTFLDIRMIILYRETFLRTE